MYANTETTNCHRTFPDGEPLRSSRVSLYGKVLGLQGSGGDLLDVIQRGTEEIGLTLGDVTGHGAEAAPYAARVLRELETLEQGGRSQRRWMKRFNARLCSVLDDEHFFATLSARFAWTPYNDNVGVTIANAGMPPALVYRRQSDSVEIIAEHAPPLGIDSDADWLPEISALVLQPGDCIVFVSDGVTEQRDRRGRMLSVRRLARWLQRFGHEGGESALRRLLGAWWRFRAGTAPGDDTSIVVAEITSPTYAAPRAVA